VRCGNPPGQRDTAFARAEIFRFQPRSPPRESAAAASLCRRSPNDLLRFLIRPPIKKQGSAGGIVLCLGSSNHSPAEANHKNKSK
jgi:hypothetical protein